MSTSPHPGEQDSNPDPTQYNQAPRGVLRRHNVQSHLYSCPSLSRLPLTREDVVESCLHIGGIQSRRLKEGQPILLCKNSVSSGECHEVQPDGMGLDRMEGGTCKAPGLISGHGPQVPQVTLVAHQHDDNVGISMVLQLLQPALCILIRQVLGNIIDEQSSHCPPVVPGEQ